MRCRPANCRPGQKRVPANPSKGKCCQTCVGKPFPTRPPMPGPQKCPVSVTSCPKGQKRVLKYGSSFPIRIQGKRFKPRRLGRRGRRKLLTEGEESVSALPPSDMRRRCGKVYVCVPDTPIDGPQPCPKSVKTCPAGFKRVLKKGWEGRGGPSKRFQKVGKRSRKLLSEDEALPLYVMKERCGPIYECVRDTKPVSCPKYRPPRCKRGQRISTTTLRNGCTKNQFAFTASQQFLVHKHVQNRLQDVQKDKSEC
jgi:hypothetical protein